MLFSLSCDHDVFLYKAAEALPRKILIAPVDDRPLGINRIRDGDEVVSVAGGAFEECDSLGPALGVFRRAERFEGHAR